MYDWCAPMKNIIKTVKENIILIFGSIINCIVQFYKKMSGHKDGTDEDWEIHTMTFSSKRNKSKNEREKGNVRNRQNESKNRSQSRKTNSRGSNNDDSKSYEKQPYRQEGENRATRRANAFKQEKNEPEKTHTDGTNHVEEEENWDFDKIANNIKLVRSTVSKLDTVESVESAQKNKEHSRNRDGSKITNIEPEEVTQTNEKKDGDNSKMEEKAETSAKRNKKSSRKKNILESVNIETEKIVQEYKENHTKKKENSKHDNKTKLYRKGKDLSFKSDGESSSLDEKEKSFEDTNKSETEEPPPVKENSDAPVKENSDWANISLSDIPEFVPGSFQTVKQIEVAVDDKFIPATITKTDTNYPNNWVDVKNEKQGTIQIENNYEPATIQTEDNSKRTRSGKRNGDRQIYDAYKKHIDRKFYKNQDQNYDNKNAREKSSSSFNRPRYDSKERNKIYRSRPQENDNTKTRNNSDWPLEKRKNSETKTSRKDNSIVFEAQSYQNLSDKNVKAKPLDKSTTPLDEQGKWNLEKQYKKSTTADTNYKNTPNIKPYYQNEEQETSTSDWYLESINSDKDNPNHGKDNTIRINNEEPKYESDLPLERQENTTDKNWDSDAKNSYYDDGFKSPKYLRKNTRHDSYQKDRRSDKYADNYSNNSWRDKSGGDNSSRQDNWSKNRDRHSDRGYTGNFANTSYENRQRRRSFGSFKPPYNSWRWEDDVFSNGYSFRQFKNDIDIDSYKFTKIHEENKNLFDTDEEFALAHCVAEDMNMGSGIAVEFRKKFGEVEKLLDQRKKSGELALLTDACRPKEKKRAFVYYLVTKVFSSGKPTYESFVSSVEKMREHIRENNVKKLAIPRLGCGLDRLEWDTVKLLMEFLFFDDDIEILVCNWTPPESSTPQKKLNCIVTDYLNPISNIDPQTIIILPTSEDKEESKEMKDLDEKFHFLPQFRYENVQSGNIVQYIKNEYAIFVCIVKKNKLDRFNFVSFGQCLRKIKNCKHKSVKDYYYVGFQAIEDPHDEFINAKIINLLRNIFDGKEIYYCWPPTMKNDPTYKNREDLQSSRESSYNKDF